MKKTELMNRISGTISKAGFRLRKHSPEILVVTGIVGTVTSAVLACRATTKLSGILEKTKEDLETIHNCAGREDLAEPYSEEDAKKDTALVYIHTGKNLAKLYAPSVALGVVSIAGILASNKILRKRNACAAAAFAGLAKEFKEYRGRVAERFGENVERELKYDLKARKVEETIIDENGKEKKVKKTVEVSGVDGYSSYARFFDSASKYWEEDPEYNLMYLRTEESYANDRLKARGYLFLNEVYDRLGIPPTKEGQVVGWIYDEKNPIGDNFVDFGIYNVNREKNRDFVNGYENVILLDFNVDGNILDSI